MTAVTRIGGGSSQGCHSKNITTSTTTLVITGPATLVALVFNKPIATGVITIYDGVSASGTLLGTITIPTSPMPVTLTYNIECAVGITIVTATAAQDLTVCFRP